MEPDLVIFDEPTNHMDSGAIERFEVFLNDLRCGYMIVSHDRRLLDNCTDDTVFLKHQKFSHFHLPYSQARSELENAEAAAEQRRADELAEIKRLNEASKKLAT